MMRQSSSRNQRSKGGFKLRHFIQVCLLVAICIWLVYQIKHSRDKKRAFEERRVVEAQPLPLRFSRKDLPVVQVSDPRSEFRSVDEDKSEVEDHEEEEQEQELKKEEEQEQELKKEEAQDEEGNGGADDWIDEQDQDRSSEENEQEEFTSEEENETPVEETDSANSQGDEDSAMGASEENYKSDNFSRSVAQETHSTAVETGFADERSLDDKNLHGGDADMKGNSSSGAVVASNFNNSSAMGDFNGLVINSTGSSLGKDSALPEAANHPVNGTPMEKNGSTSGYIYQQELQTNITAALPQIISMSTSNNSTMESYGEILGNITSNLTHFEDKSPAKFVEPVHELEDQGKPKTREEQGSDEHLKTGSFSTNEGDMSRTGATIEERMAHAGLGVAGG